MTTGNGRWRWQTRRSLPPIRASARDDRSEAELDAEGDLIALGQEPCSEFAGESTEAPIFEPEPQRGTHVITYAETVVDAIAQPADIGHCRADRANLARRVALRVTQPTVERERAIERPARVHVEV